VLTGRHQCCLGATSAALAPPVLPWRHQCCLGATSAALAPPVPWRRQCCLSLGAAKSVFHHPFFLSDISYSLASPLLSESHSPSVLLEPTLSTTHCALFCGLVTVRSQFSVQQISSFIHKASTTNNNTLPKILNNVNKI
jgi:hypothetical protein